MHPHVPLDDLVDALELQVLHVQIDDRHLVARLGQPSVRLPQHLVMFALKQLNGTLTFLNLSAELLIKLSVHLDLSAL